MPGETEHDIKVIIPAHSTRLMMCLPIDEYNALKAQVAALQAECERLSALWQSEHTERIRLEEALKMAQKISDSYRDVYALDKSINAYDVENRCEVLLIDNSRCTKIKGHLGWHLGAKE